MTQQSIKKIIQQNKTKIKELGVLRIGLFGSFVRKEETPKSDIDILVEFNKGEKTFDNFYELKNILEKALHRKVDLVVKSSLKKSIKKNILEEVSYAKL
jgi:predicted nucleotidyltransferase